MIDEDTTVRDTDFDTSGTNRDNILTKNRKKRKQLMKDFAEINFPLTMDCMADLYAKNPESDCYCWNKGCMPWEGACV